jgi:hypothetical protein
VAGVCYVILANWGKGNNGIMEEWNDGIMDKQIGVGYRLQNARCELQVPKCKLPYALCTMRYALFLK